MAKFLKFKKLKNWYFRNLKVNIKFINYKKLCLKKFKFLNNLNTAFQLHQECLNKLIYPGIHTSKGKISTSTFSPLNWLTGSTTLTTKIFKVGQLSIIFPLTTAKCIHKTLSLLAAQNLKFKRSWTSGISDHSMTQSSDKIFWSITNHILKTQTTIVKFYIKTRSKRIKTPTTHPTAEPSKNTALPKSNLVQNKKPAARPQTPILNFRIFWFWLNLLFVKFLN